jgi:hypothetical protein
MPIERSKTLSLRFLNFVIRIKSNKRCILGSINEKELIQMETVRYFFYNRLHHLMSNDQYLIEQYSTHLKRNKTREMLIWIVDHHIQWYWFLSIFSNGWIELIHKKQNKLDQFIVVVVIQSMKMEV